MQWASKVKCIIFSPSDMSYREVLSMLNPLSVNFIIYKECWSTFCQSICFCFDAISLCSRLSFLSCFLPPCGWIATWQPLPGCCGCHTSTFMTFTLINYEIKRHIPTKQRRANKKETSNEKPHVLWLQWIRTVHMAKDVQWVQNHQHIFRYV